MVANCKTCFFYEKKKKKKITYKQTQSIEGKERGGGKNINKRKWFTFAFKKYCFYRKGITKEAFVSLLV